MIEFEKDIFLYLLFTIPFFVGLFIYVMIKKARQAEKYGDRQLVDKLMPMKSKARQIIKFVFLMIALAFLLVGLANPQIGSKIEKIKRKGIELIIALDVSNSMLAEDIQPNRLERAKRAISQLVSRLKNDKIGLIVFAGDAYVQLPITTDYASAKMFLSTISPDAVPVQGTSIGSAIDLAMNSYSPDNENNKALIIITDGENHEEDAVELAKEASEKGIIVHTIGMGKPEGVPIPEYGKYGNKDFRVDKNGEIVISKLNEKMLRQIASAGQGYYVLANNSKTGLNKLFDEIDEMTKQEFETQSYSDFEDRFQYFIAFAIFFLLLDILLLPRKNKMFKNMNIFKTPSFNYIKKK